MSEFSELLSCSLSTVSASSQLLEWNQIRSEATHSRVFDDGFELSFPLEMKDQVLDLAEREEQCCDFLNIEIKTVDDLFVIEVRSDNKAASPVLRLLGGTS